MNTDDPNACYKYFDINLDDPCWECPHYLDCPDDNPEFDYNGDLFPANAKCLSPKNEESQNG